jgi:hypothetical protein
MRSQPVAAITTGGPAVPERANAIAAGVAAADAGPIDATGVTQEPAFRPPGRKRLSWRIRLRRDKMLLLMTSRRSRWYWSSTTCRCSA